MSATTRSAARAPHYLLQRGPTGVLHAAIATEIEGTHRTACGENLADSRRGKLIRTEGLAAMGELHAHPERICRRCDRVGLAVSA